MAKKHVDPLKAKEKKQKILAAVLGVAFLGLVAFQAPRVMKQLNPPEPASASSETSTTAPPPTGTPTLAAPTLSGPGEVSASATPGSPEALIGGSTVVQDGQLANLSRFASKDPFAQQLSDDVDGTTSSGGSTGSSSSGGATGSSSSGGATGSSSIGSSEQGIPDIPGNAPVPGSAIISVNGTLYTVPAGTDFPQASTTDPTLVPLFHLISLTAHTAKISIVGGSYENGARAITLKEGKPLTLMNTADGTRYQLILKPLGTEVPSTSAGTTTTPTTITLPPATP
jgi:hypothetical protein